MSEEQLKGFLKKVQSDPELKQKLEVATSLDDLVETAKAAGFIIVEDDLKKLESEVSVEELEAAAGGDGGWIKASIKAGKAATICATPYIVAITIKYC